MTPGTLGPLGALHSGRAGCSHGESGCGGAGSRLPAPTGLLGGRGSSSRATLGTRTAPCPPPISPWQHSLRAPARLAEGSCSLGILSTASTPSSSLPTLTPIPGHAPTYHRARPHIGVTSPSHARPLLCGACPTVQVYLVVQLMQMHLSRELVLVDGVHLLSALHAAAGRMDTDTLPALPLLHQATQVRAIRNFDVHVRVHHPTATTLAYILSANSAVTYNTHSHGGMVNPLKHLLPHLRAHHHPTPTPALSTNPPSLPGPAQVHRTNPEAVACMLAYLRRILVAEPWLQDSVPWAMPLAIDLLSSTNMDVLRQALKVGKGGGHSSACRAPR
jgi:hypothetical protein